MNAGANFLQRLLGRLSKRNAIKELRNRIAEKGIESIDHEYVGELESRYGVSFDRDLSEERKAVYRDFLDACLTDKWLDNNEISELRRLRDLLGLTDRQEREVREAAVTEVYRETLKEALADNEINEDERRTLQLMQENLAISEEQAARIYRQTATERLQSILDKAISDKELSPEEDKEMEQVARNLGITLSLSDKTKAALERYRLYWQIKNGELPEPAVTLNLSKGEHCHFFANINWYELQQVTRRTRSGGPTFRLKLMKGIYWRMENLGLRRLSEDEMTLVDSGTVYLTNTRLLFLGSRKNSMIRLNSILDYEVYSNGVQLQNSSGASPFLEFSKNVDLFALILARLLRQRSYSKQ
ncbi:MAG: TerB family tellurite resistance protein [Spirochaetales bacterium]|nr:TerB family tellurite resistance protein [Spirochaetales bacterium]MCF7937014.1 TerB family tellurite resistance protein [Spirochaetales bacterium]